MFQVYLSLQKATFLSTRDLLVPVKLVQWYVPRSFGTKLLICIRSNRRGGGRPPKVMALKGSTGLNANFSDFKHACLFTENCL